MAAVGTNALSANLEGTSQYLQRKEEENKLEVENRNIERDIRQKEEIIKILTSLTSAEIQEFNHYKGYKKKVSLSIAAAATVGGAVGVAVVANSDITPGGATGNEIGVAAVTGAGLGVSTGILGGMKVDEIVEPSFFKRIPDLYPLSRKEIDYYFNYSINILSEDIIVNERGKLYKEIDSYKMRYHNNESRLKALKK